MRVLVMLDGATVADPDAPQLRVTDLGLLRGDGIFETILVTDRQPRELELHLQRLVVSAAKLELAEPDVPAWRRCIDKAIEQWPGPDLAIRLIYTRGTEDGAAPTAFVLGSELPAQARGYDPAGISVLTLERGIDPGLMARAPWLLLGSKSLSYALNMAALREANRRGADDVIFTATDGSVLEGPRSTVVLARNGVLRTPPKEAGILAGTTQAGLYRAAAAAGWDVRVEPISVEDLFAADAVVFTSSLRRVVGVHTVDGASLRPATQLHRELYDLYDQQYR